MQWTIKDHPRKTKMKFSPQQAQALTDIKHWHDRRDKQIFRLEGYAGTGKTSLAKHIAEMIPGKVFFCAFTGKAAHALHMKGCAGASTIHSLIYLPKQGYEARAKEYLEELEELRIQISEEVATPGEHKIRITQLEEILKDMTTVKFILDENSEAENAALIIVDESSMVSNQLAEDLLSFNRPILTLGDPAQLPPVKGAGYFSKILPDVLLTEVHRQALESPVLKLATDIRNGVPLHHGRWDGDRDGESAAVMPREEMTFTEMMKCGQILCGMNATRRKINRRYRNQLGILNNKYPVIGEQLISLKNCFEDGLLNGTLCKVKSLLPDGDCLNSIKLGVTTELGEYTALKVNREIFDAYETGEYDQNKNSFFAVGHPMDFSYAITVHKSQGSQWEDVVVCNETPSMWNQSFKKKWLYTAVTRASKNIIILT